MSVSDLISSLQDIVSRMRSVADGEFVRSEHTNLFVDYTRTALELVKGLYEVYKARTGRTLPTVERMISMAEGRVGFMRKVRFGDLVETRDHNLVIDSLKPIELALKEIERNL